LSITFSRFAKGKREFSSSDSAGDFLGTYEQFSVPQWIKSGITIREASCFAITAATLFAIYKLCDFGPFGIGTMKEVLKDREFNSSNEIEEVITKV
jgi:hypothetical protein